MGDYLKAEAVPIGDGLEWNKRDRKLYDSLRVCISYKEAGDFRAGFNLRYLSEGHIQIHV
jgi:hypothetical protein